MASSVLHACACGACSPRLAPAPLPAGARALAAAVGGHGGMLSCSVCEARWLCPALAASLRGLVLKPLPAAPDGRGARERAWYAAAAAARAGGARRSGGPPPLARLAGECAGGFLALEDVTAARRRPCVLDVKMGRRATGPDAAPAKAAAEAAKCPLQASVGFRLTGMRVADGAGGGGGYRQRGRSLRGEVSLGTLADALRDFLRGGGECEDGGAPVMRAALAAPIVRALLRVRGWVAEQNEWRLWGSSLLFVYDGEGGGDADAADAAVSVHMIDFAHAWPVAALPPEAAAAAAAEARDDGYLFGLDNLIACFLVVLADAPGGAARHLQGEWLRSCPCPQPVVPLPFPSEMQNSRGEASLGMTQDGLAPE